MVDYPINLKRTQSRDIAIIVFIIAVGVAGYFLLNAPDQRTDGEKIGNAIDELSGGINKAARQLEPRTLGDKLDDAAKDTADKLKGTRQ